MLKRINKYFVLLLVVVIALGIAAGFLTGCKPKEKERAAADNIYSDSGYVDYAKEVFYDTEKFPELSNHGLFWTKWDTNNAQVETLRAGTSDGASLVDPAKPTIILVHGMMHTAYQLNSQERYYLNGDVARPEEFGLDTNYVPLIRLWQLAGWNVGVFHYNAFTAEGTNVTGVEAKIWSTDGSLLMSHRNTENKLVYGSSNYSIAEHFAAEYIRAMNQLPDSMGDNEIRIAGHSLGGVLSTTGLFLLTELADDGQIPQKQVPNRLALLDAGFGIKLIAGDKVVFESEKEFTISWSKKPLYNYSTSDTMLECAKAMVSKGIVIEFYAYESSWANLSIPRYVFNELKTMSTFVLLYPDYSDYSKKYSIVTHGHVAILEWYLFSIAFPPVKDVSAGAPEGALAASASTPTDYMKNNQIGVTYKITGGQRTVPTSDDLFVKVIDE